MVNMFVQEVKLRKVWLKSFGYKIYRNNVSVETIALLKEEVNEEVIAQATGLDTTGRKWKKIRRSSDAADLDQFFKHFKETLVKIHSGYSSEHFPEIWPKICKIIINYFTLESGYGVYYYYHLPFFNHIHNKDLICVLFFLLHTLDNNVLESLEAFNLGRKPIILQQGLSFHQF